MVVEEAEGLGGHGGGQVEGTEEGVEEPWSPLMMDALPLPVRVSQAC